MDKSDIFTRRPVGAGSPRCSVAGQAKLQRPEPTVASAPSAEA